MKTGVQESSTAQTPEIKDNNKLNLYPDLPVNEADLIKAWKEYAETIKNETPDLYSMLVYREPKLNNNLEIIIELLAQSQEIEFTKEKDKLLEFLKVKLQNNHLRIKTIISKDKHYEISEAVTTSDILKAMMLKNPALAKLTMELNLEIE